MADSLYKQLGLAEDVVPSLEADTSIGVDLRSAVSRIARARGDDPRMLQLQAWRVTRSAGELPKAYFKARRQAEKVYELSFQHSSAFFYLGAAQYRTGAYSECLATLAGMDRFPNRRQRTLGLIFAAMARQKFRQTDQARKLLQSVSERGFDLGDSDCRTLFDEAYSLIPEWWEEKRKASK